MCAMTRRRKRTGATASTRRIIKTVSRLSQQASSKVLKQASRTAEAKVKPPPGTGDWLAGRAFGMGGSRRYQLFRPCDVSASERLPLLVMLHGCSQNARNFASSTRMNAIAVKARALVLYPEQDLRVNPQGCWNWYDTKNRQADAEANTLLSAINQVALLYPIDRKAIAIAGFSAGAGMAALLASRHPERFCAVAMHSGVPPGSARSAASAVSAMGGMQRSKSTEGLQSLPPLLLIHGVKDRVVAFRNAQNAAQMWASSFKALATKPRTVQRGKRYASTITDYRVGKQVVVSLHAISELKHSWSGGDGRQRFSEPAGPDASLLIWRFVERQLKAAS